MGAKIVIKNESTKLLADYFTYQYYKHKVAFMFQEKDWFFAEKVGMNLNRYNISKLDMTKSNFSEDEKIRLRALIKMGIRLIL